ncbi:MAG: DNA translocase FtsK [Dehalococcoidia bacterium]|nr:DNA translocase FtsK [Dehalococcoidia bacterium]
MARAKARRSRAVARGAPQFPDLFTVGGRLLRPEVVGTVLVVMAAAVIPFLFPFAGVLSEGRDGLIRALGVHVFTLTLVVAAIGTMLALQYTIWLRRHVRHLVGASMLLVFSAGVLGLWKPATSVGGVSLALHSAGGDFGRFLVGEPVALLVWIALLPVGFTLVWPRTARMIALNTPPVSAAIAHATVRGLDRLGLHRAAGRGLRSGGRALAAQVSGQRAPRGGASYERTIEELAGPAAPTLSAPEEEAPRPRRRTPKTPVQIAMDMDRPPAAWRHSADGWQLPAIDTLVASVEAQDSTDENERRARLIVDTLASFGVDARVTQINEGPTITQFGVEPGWDIRTRAVVERDPDGRTLLNENGQPRTREIEVSRTRIRVNRITALQNDLALALATPALRIEAPVPGKPIVGIEVPNASARVVTLRSVMESAAFQGSLSKMALPVALGSGVSGEPAVADLAAMPHVLIAGATGAGKSVCLNAIITCLLMNHSPEQLRLIMVDPKRVELTTFESIPHLAFSNIVVDMDKVVGTLQAVIHEMESRYRRFAQAGVRNIKRYNEVVEGKGLPYWVVIIDELADLMMAAPYQVEQQLVRLAQLARATGIHLVVATQRPSVDVITGLIKANFPTRIAFAMSSQVDSRTVLDQGGAEKLLGKGDMLYVPTDAQKPIRLQGVYVSDSEIESVVKFWSDGRFDKAVPAKHDDLLREAELELAELEQPSDDGDPLLAKAIELAGEHQRISTSMLQRRLRIGYPRAARLIDDLEERGVVGPPDGPSGSREVLRSSETAGAEVLDGTATPVALRSYGDDA